MTIRAKMALGTVAIITLVLLAGWLLVREASQVLRDEIGRSAVARAEDLATNIDRLARERRHDLAEAVALETHPELAAHLRRSNADFARRAEQGILESQFEEIDSRWGRADEAPSAEMDEAMRGPVADNLRAELAYHARRRGAGVFGEMFVTNRYGANVAQTGPTTDYRQDDEPWWTTAARDGAWIGEPAYDESTESHAIGLATAILDETGELLGVAKATLEIQEVYDLLDRFEQTAEYAGAFAELADRDGRILYRRGQPEPEPGPVAESSPLSGPGTEEGFVVQDGDPPLLRAWAQATESRAEGAGTGLAVVLNYDANAVLAPLRYLQEAVLGVALWVVGLVVVLGVVIPQSILRPIPNAVRVANRVLRGDLDAQFRIRGSDETTGLLRAMKGIVDALRRASETAARLATGDTRVQADAGRGEDDALGQAFRDMARYNKEIEEVAKRIAGGDLDVKVVPRGEHDTVNKAFSRTVAYVKEVADVAQRISTGDLLVQVHPRSTRDVLNRAFATTIEYLQDVARVASRVADGDLDVDVQARSEVDILNNSLVEMIANLRKMVVQLDGAANVVIDTTAELAQATKQINAGARAQKTAGGDTEQAMESMTRLTVQTTSVSASVTEQVRQTRNTIEATSRAAQEIADGTRELSAAADRATATTEAMRVTIDEVSDHANTVQSLVTTAVEAAQGGDAVVTGAIETMGRVDRVMEELGTEIRHLSDASRQIGVVVDVLEDLIEQSNLLSLNAAIMAAQAGQEGHGFGVVAREIRRLATDSRRSAHRIGSVVAQIRSATVRAAEVANRSQAGVRDGVTLVERAGDALTRIRETVEGVNARMRAVGDAARVQITASETLEGAMDTVATMARRIADNTNTQSDNVQRMLAAASTMDELAKRLGGAAKEQGTGAQRVQDAIANIARVSSDNEQLGRRLAELNATLAREADALRSTIKRFRW